MDNFIPQKTRNLFSRQNLESYIYEDLVDLQEQDLIHDDVFDAYKDIPRTDELLTKYANLISEHLSLGYKSEDQCDEEKNTNTEISG